MGQTGVKEIGVDGEKTSPQEVLSKIKGKPEGNMAKGRRTDLPTAALVMEMKETEGRSENEISKLTGVPAGTVHNILSRAHGWDEIAEGDVFQATSPRTEQSLGAGQSNLSQKILGKGRR